MWGKKDLDKLPWDFISLLRNSMVILKGQYFFWCWDNFYQYSLWNYPFILGPLYPLLIAYQKIAQIDLLLFTENLNTFGQEPCP